MVVHQTLLLAGLATGLSVAVPVGPMGLLCIQRTLHSGAWIGISTGLGAATVNVIYGALILLGMDALAPLMASGFRLLNFCGGVYLLLSASRLLTRHGCRAPENRALSPTAAYGSAVAFNAANPASPMLIFALLSSSAGAAPASPADAAAVLLGMFTAAVAWWICLSLAVAALRSRLTPRALAMVNQLAAVILAIYGALALARSFEG